MSEIEFTRLYDAAYNGRPYFDLSGKDRAILYLTAAYTGLRAGELASLTPDNFDFEADPPAVTVEASYSKHRRRDVLPLNHQLAGRLHGWITEKAREPSDAKDRSKAVPGQENVSTGLLWPGTWCDNAAEMLRRDLKTAEIPYHDNAGRVFDFHALRHQFISNLAKSGAHPKVAQSLARHGTITLTMDRYTHLSLWDMDNAVQKLPDLPEQGSRPDQLQATGTDGNSLVSQLVHDPGFSCPSRASSDKRSSSEPANAETKKPLQKQGFGDACVPHGTSCHKRGRWDSNPQPPDRQSGTLTN